MRAYRPPVKYLQTGTAPYATDEHVMRLHRYVLQSDRMPDFSFADGWPLATKAVTYAMHSCPGPEIGNDFDALKFIYINELVCQFHSVECPTWPFSIADVAKALKSIFADESGNPDGGLPGEGQALLRSFDMHKMGLTGICAFGVAPVISSVKYWLASGVPILAGIAVPDDWDTRAKGGDHTVSPMQAPEPYDDATVIAVVGWDDNDATFIFRYMEGNGINQGDTGRIGVNEVLGGHARIELAAITTF